MEPQGVKETAAVMEGTVQAAVMVIRDTVPAAATEEEGDMAEGKDVAEDCISLLVVQSDMAQGGKRFYLSRDSQRRSSPSNGMLCLQVRPH